MEVLASILGSIVAETGRSLGGSISSNIKSISRWKSNILALEKEMNGLIDLRSTVKHQFESRDGRMSSANKVEEWLRGTEELLINVEAIRTKIMSSKEKKHFCVRIRFNRELTRAIKKIQRLVKDENFFDVNCSMVKVEYIPGPSIPQDQMTSSRTLDNLIEILDDDKYMRIGVWGLGGVGKTTLVKNLNNKLKTNDCLKKPFSAVIWATVSKDMDMKRVQMQIAERLNLEVRVEDSVEGIAGKLYQRLDKEEKFLLVLDDVWERIDLDCLGVPWPPETLQRGSKVVLTTRSLEVCGAMMTDIDVKVDVLSESEAWRLFCRNACFDTVRLEQIKPLAEAVARECGGLPLAIVTTGAAMRGKTKARLWKYALHELRRSEPFVGGIKSQVYNHLKLSYDSLESSNNNNAKACFLYCALFPEDFSIDFRELARCWFSEGLIDENRDFESSFHKATAIIELLKDSCLLEDGDQDDTVKMHDVVRDVAIWIGSSLDDGFKFHVRSGIGLSEISESELSDSLGRVSFANNNIKALPDCEVRCSKASTLMLQGNIRLEKVPEKFLQPFRSLKVLNLSDTRVRSLPRSLLQLGELRALLLRNCYFLEELPPLGSLTKLQILDLCATRIREVPQDMENLTNLRQLNLSRTHYLQSFRAGIVSKWTCLEVLDMTLSDYHWDTKGNAKDGQTSFEELSCLKKLFSLSIRLKKIPCLGSEDTTWIDRLRRFQFFIGTTANSLPSRHDKRRVTISGLTLPEEWMGWLLKDASSLVMNGCRGLNEMFEGLALYCAENYINLNSVNECSFMSLKSLTITSSNDRIKQGGCAALYDLVPNLEELRLHGLNNLTSVSEFVGHLGLLFPKLKLIEVTRCPQMKCLISYGNLILSLPSLEKITVSFCEKLEELFDYTSDGASAVEPVVPGLRILELKSLPKVKKLCRERESWPKLEQVCVVKCNLLANLPLDVRNASVMKEIRGESQWWAGLKWDNPGVESALRVFLKPVGVA